MEHGELNTIDTVFPAAVALKQR